MACLNSVLRCRYMPSKKINPVAQDTALSIPGIDPQLRYEEALKELEKLVSEMESGKLSLEETLSAYQRGTALLKHCQGVLAQVEQQVKFIET
jgi:exodeoxyribonuclease VII small subunit